MFLLPVPLLASERDGGSALEVGQLLFVNLPNSSQKNHGRISPTDCHILWEGFFFGIWKQGAAVVPHLGITW